MEDVRLANREINTGIQSVSELFSLKRLKTDLLIIVVIGIILGYLSPFGMDDVPLGYSIGYWVFICLCGYVIYPPTIIYGEKSLQTKLPSLALRITLSVFLASVLMSLLTPLISWLFFGGVTSYGGQFLETIPKAIVIGGVITIITIMKHYIGFQQNELIEQQLVYEQHVKDAESNDHKQIDKFMGLIPLEKRGELYCLEMEDHYVKVYTSKGHHLLLMRFKDAIELLSDCAGLQTHRSWWVAIAAVTSTNKVNRKVTLTLVNELEVPVSRTYISRVKAAGII